MTEAPAYAILPPVTEKRFRILNRDVGSSMAVLLLRIRFDGVVLLRFADADEHDCPGKPTRSNARAQTLMGESRAGDPARNAQGVSSTRSLCIMRGHAIRLHRRERVQLHTRR
jgi:hypothetical protein